MEHLLDFDILPQPNETTCGPTCLHAVYRYYGDHLPLEQVISETVQLAEGGTLAVLLGIHALRRGYDVTIHTLNLQVFDPTWFREGAPPLADRLVQQMAVKDSPKLHMASRGYLELLELGGSIRMFDASVGLLRKYLKRSIPVLTGLSATYLYGSAREYGPTCIPDDVRGFPVGHFVVLCGFDSPSRAVLVADPFQKNPMGSEHFYEVSADRVIQSILLGVITYDANLLIIKQRDPR